MYNDLDSPPPRSQFLPDSFGRQYTRPWSPDPYDPYNGDASNAGGSRAIFNELQRAQQSRGDHDDPQPQGLFAETYPPLPRDQFPVLHSKPKREASEVSVEALDLADYARTLRVRQAEDPYPAFPFAESSLNSSTKQVHQSKYTSHPPSAYPAPIFTRGGTRSTTHTSSTATHQTPRSNVTVPLAANTRPRSRRPFSLPNSPHSSTPHLTRQPDPENEIDISQFPAWSRNWYTNGTNNSRRNPHANVDSLEAYELEAGLALPRPLLSDSFSTRTGPHSSSSHNHHHNNNSIPSGSHRQPLSPFDPGYVHPQSYPRYDDDYPSYSAPSYTNHDPLLGARQSREGVVPWSFDPPEYGQPHIDAHTKEARIRMLEKAFGTPTDSKSKGGIQNAKDKHHGKAKKEVDDGLMRDDQGKLLIGTPNGKGGLVTQGPRMRVAVRILQILLAVAVGGPIVWAGVVLKPKPPPPPAGNPPLYILYVLSPITLILLVYLFVVRPCTVRRRYASSGAHPAAAHGMMVLPVQGSGGKKTKGGKGGMMMPPGNKKKNKKGKKGEMAMGDVQVNLIVDPNAFGLPGDDLSSSEDEEEDMFDDDGMPGAFLPNLNGNNQNPERQRAKRKRRRRRTLAASLRLEEEWRLARTWMRKLAFVDAFVFLLWGVAFGFVIAGKRCPTGGTEKGYGGWCTAYNASTAASCLLCVSFAVSIYFGVKDIYASKLSPRTRI